MDQVLLAMNVNVFFCKGHRALLRRCCYDHNRCVVLRQFFGLNLSRKRRILGKLQKFLINVSDMLSDKLSIPGIHSEIIPGLMGDLEVIMEVPSDADHRYLAMLGHPHSLQGGTMQNKVVTTMARAFRELGIASIRFNFRGVGRSAGEYAAGIGESEDMLHLLSLCHAPDVTVFFSGFSFGSYVAFKALTQYQATYSGATALITIAPSVHNYDYSLPLQPKTPWLIVIGEEDELVSLNLVTDFAQTHEQKPVLECFPNTGHFFHGKLLDLKAVLQRYIREWSGL